MNYAEYLQARLQEFIHHPRAREIVEAVIDARRWESPRHFTEAHAAAAIKEVGSALAAGYWTRVAIRALILLDLTSEEREAMITQAAEFETEAWKTIGQQAVQQPTADLTHRVDLGKIEI